MDKVKIKIVKLGKQKHEYIFKKLQKYRTKIFSVDIFEQSRPECDYDWGYSFQTLETILTKDFDNNKYDMCIGFVDTIIENNFFAKRLRDHNIYVISFFEADELLKAENIDLFNYVLSTMYRYITRFKLNGKYLTHHETKGCLFDHCGNKQDIIYSSNRPILCTDCVSKIKQTAIESEYLTALSKEIKRIRKTNYYYLSDFIKKHPYISILIGLVSSFIVNILSDIVMML